MTADQLHTVEAELEKRGYRKYTQALTSSETYAWFKTFNKERDEDDYVISGWQVAFRVWDYRDFRYRDKNIPEYGLDFWTSALGTDGRMDFTSNWEPIRNILVFEHMAEEFNQLVKRYLSSKQESL